MKQPSLLLVYPRTRYRTGDPPLGLGYLAAVVRRARPDLEVELLDLTFERGGLAAGLARVRQSGAAIVGVYVDSLSRRSALALAAAARAAGAATVAGGPAVSVDPGSFVPGFDVAVLGEGEALIVPLVERLLAGSALDDLPNLVWRDGTSVRATPLRAAHPDLEALPWPAWDLFDMTRYTALWPYLDASGVKSRGTNVVASRGCPWQCSYCQPTLSSLFGRRVRRRSVENVVAEIEALQGRYGIDGVFFHDDTLTADEGWLLELCRALERLPRRIWWGCNSRVDTLPLRMIAPMTSAGLRSVHLGIEAGSRRVREQVLGKAVDLEQAESLVRALARAGVHVLGFFMLGSPTETLAEMFATTRLAARLPFTEATFSLVAALPGTHLHARLHSDARFALQDAADVDYYRARNFRDREHPGAALVLRGMQWFGLVRFYARPRRLAYVARHLASWRGLRKLMMKLARFLPG